MKTLQKFAWVCAAVLGVLAAVLFMFLPALVVDVPVVGKTNVTGVDLAFGEEGHWFFIIEVILLILGAVSALVGILKNKKLLFVTALILLVAGVIAFLTKTVAVANAVNEMKEAMGALYNDVLKDGVKDMYAMGIGAVLSGILAILGAGAAAFGALEK